MSYKRIGGGTGDNTPKPYASGEKSKYVTDTLTNISKMESHKSKLEDTLGKLRNKYIGWIKRIDFEEKEEGK